MRVFKLMLHAFYRVDPNLPVPLPAGGELHILPVKWSVDRRRNLLTFTTALSSEPTTVQFLPMGPLQHSRWRREVERKRAALHAEYARLMGLKAFEAMQASGCQ